METPAPAAPKKNAPTVYYSLRLPLLEKGAEGESVKALQHLLICNEHYLGRNGADGIFGSDTDKAVRAYQSANGLEVDGEVGPKTWAKLLGV